MAKNIEGKTTDGFSFKVEEEQISNNFEFVDLYTEYIHKKNGEDLSEEEEFWYVIRLVEQMLGVRQFKKLKRHCRVGGMIRADRINRNVMEIFQFSGENETVKKL